MIKNAINKSCPCGGLIQYNEVARSSILNAEAYIGDMKVNNLFPPRLNWYVDFLLQICDTEVITLSIYCEHQASIIYRAGDDRFFD